MVCERRRGSRNVHFSIGLLCLTIAGSGCTTSNDIQTTTPRERAIACRDQYGLVPGTAKFSSCMEKLAQSQDQQNQRAAVGYPGEMVNPYIAPPYLMPRLFW